MTAPHFLADFGTLLTASLFVGTLHFSLRSTSSNRHADVVSINNEDIFVREAPTL